MPRPKSEDIARCREMARELGVSFKALWNSGITRRRMGETARQTLINNLKKVKEPHGEPMLMGHGIALIETEDAITLTIRKQPQAEKPRAIEETPDVIAVRRAGGM